MKEKLIGEGRTAEILQYKDQTILKLYRENVSEQSILHEYKISEFVYARGVRTPKPYELITVDERKGILFEQIQGPTLLKMIDRQPWRISKYAKMMAELHYSLHTLDVTEDIGQQKERYRSCIKGAPLLTEDEKSVILSYLEDLPEEQKLCHGDFHPDNVLMDQQAWIIDWMTGLAGNPAGDAARSVIMFSIGEMPEKASPLLKFMIRFIRKKLTKDYIREYLRLSGRTYAEIDQWILPVAAARLVEWLSTAEKEQIVEEIRKRLSSLPVRL
ncbi:MAG: phosphotransferase [Paenibacillus sp.]|nr:phosphotransferase [Paenibacillus sp.]